MQAVLQEFLADLHGIKLPAPDTNADGAPAAGLDAPSAEDAAAAAAVDEAPAAPPAAVSRFGVRDEPEEKEKEER